MLHFEISSTAAGYVCTCYYSGDVNTDKKAYGSKSQCPSTSTITTPSTTARNTTPTIRRATTPTPTPAPLPVKADCDFETSLCGYARVGTSNLLFSWQRMKNPKSAMVSAHSGRTDLYFSKYSGMKYALVCKCSKHWC